MVIRSSREYYAITIVLFLSLVAAALLIRDMGGDVIAISFILLTFPWAIHFWVVVGRTLIFEKDGCTVKFMGFCRVYKWEELRVKRYVDLTAAFRTRMQSYTAGAIFSVKSIKVPSWMMPGDYSPFVHPFKFFFVYFVPGMQKKREKRCVPSMFVVDEEVFRRKMEDWGVELE